MVEHLRDGRQDSLISWDGQSASCSFMSILIRVLDPSGYYSINRMLVMPWILCAQSDHIFYRRPIFGTPHNYALWRFMMPMIYFGSCRSIFLTFVATVYCYHGPHALEYKFFFRFLTHLEKYYCTKCSEEINKFLKYKITFFLFLVKK